MHKAYYPCSTCPTLTCQHGTSRLCPTSTKNTSCMKYRDVWCGDMWRTIQLHWENFGKNLCFVFLSKWENNISSTLFAPFFEKLSTCPESTFRTFLASIHSECVFSKVCTCPKCTRDMWTLILRKFWGNYRFFNKNVMIFPSVFILNKSSIQCKTDSRLMVTGAHDHHWIESGCFISQGKQKVLIKRGTSNIRVKMFSFCVTPTFGCQQFFLKKI